MPLSGGTSGAHDDSMHQGSAKRDVAEGLAGLDVGGHVLAPGYRFTAARGAAEQITIRERTSDERVVRFIRIGANDYEARVNVGGVEKVVQHAGLKDVVNGIAALDAAGALLVPGSKIYYTRDGSNDVHIYERTSNEEAYAFHRVGANDYTLHVKESNVWERAQTESMKDVVNGIAALDGSGDLLVPGSELHLTRTGTDWVFVKERTSGEVVFQFRRMGADDYVPAVVNSGAPSSIQLANMKGVASGIAGLDANILLSPALLPPCMEEYSNHLGAVDNFTQTGVAGTGSVNSDAANHEMDLDGGGGVGHARFETKAAWVLGSDPTMINILIQNIVNGAGGAKTSFVGCKADFTDTSVMNSMGFRQIDNGTWQAASGDAAAEETNAITALANGDLVSILATSAAIRFFVNGTLVETHTTRIPAVGVKLGGAVDHTFGAPSPHRQMSIDMMSGRRYS